MKYFLMLALALSLGCQESKKNGPTAEKVVQVEDELLKENFVLVPNIPGIQIGGSGMQKEGNITMTEDLVITETKTKKVLDEFPMLDWGMVGFILNDQTLRVFPVKDSLEISYVADEQGLAKRSVTCEFKGQHQDAAYEELMKNARAAKPDWETVLEGLSKLAKEGHKKSYEFFMAPNAEDKKLYEASKEVASVDEIFRILAYMKNNGCRW
jgi:hypothetical protein